jgi:hypothetical protein
LPSTSADSLCTVMPPFTPLGHAAVFSPFPPRLFLTFSL